MVVRLLAHELTMIQKDTPVAYWSAIFLEKSETSHKNAASLCGAGVMAT